jgi:large exoprotein involved in heme utilization and adhesion
LSPAASGNSGNINLTSTNGNISMTNGVFVTSQVIGGDAKAGTITVNAPHGDIDMQLAVLLNFIGISGTGGGGGIQVTANNLAMGLFSGIQIDNFNAPVPGPITLNLSGRLSLDGNASIFTVARGPALAAADLNITAHDVSISEGSLLSTETKSSGPGGQLNISTNTLQLTTGGQILSGSTLGVDPVTGEPVIPSGAGGTINIEGLAGPASSVLIDGAGSGIFTNAVGTGAAGNTNIAAQSVTIQNGGTISQRQGQRPAPPAATSIFSPVDPSR